jgi:CubicO group peptidase (beta-lactamase class C family)
MMILAPYRARRAVSSVVSAAKVLALTLTFLLDVAHADAVHSNRDRFPGAHWIHVRSPEQMGWSSEKLQSAKLYSESIGSAAVVIVDHGVIVSDWGSTDKKYNVHSIRKSLISALIGIAVARGQIDLNTTLQKLGIDDNAPSLTTEEEGARVIDLLKARSGIYHAALYETPGMTAAKPARGSHPPNTFWHYNNWDFNVLGTILRDAAGLTVSQDFAKEIAEPLHMEDFELGDSEYVRGPESIHPAYPFRLTARDMARFGLLYLRNGLWNGKQVVPKNWIADSTKAYSVADGMPDFGYSGYGYLWWVEINGNHIPGATLPDGSFSAEGYRGHYITVIPKLDLVIVHRFDTDKEEGGVHGYQYGKLLNLILEARTPKPSTMPGS